MTAQDNLWLRKIAENTGHSRWYIQRFRDMAARGADLAGEARMISRGRSRNPSAAATWDLRP
jgi:hypothetical protein